MLEQLEHDLLIKIFPSINITDNTISIETPHGLITFTLSQNYPHEVPSIKIESTEIQTKIDPYLKKLKTGKFMIYPLIYLVYLIAEDDKSKNEIDDVEEITEEMFVAWKNKRKINIDIKEEKLTGKYYFLSNNGNI